MIIAFFRWLTRNIGALILALVLAFAVWVTAVVTADPNEEDVFTVNGINILGQDPGLILVGDFQDQVSLTLRAPKSILATLRGDPDLISAWIDLSGKGAGTHLVDVQLRTELSPIRILKVNPAKQQVTLEPLLSREFPVDLSLEGELPLGYRQAKAILQPESARVSGPETAVSKIAGVKAKVNLKGVTETIERDVELVAVDENLLPIPNVTITPRTVHVNLPVSLLGGFKNVVIKVVTTGKVAEGYRLTNISVSPLTVTLFSDDPKLIDSIPGFVETLPVDLTGLQEYYETDADLNLPDGVRVVSDQSVLVQVSVAPIEGSLTLTIPVEIVGLAPELTALISPETVDIIVAGPLNILDGLTAEDFQVVVDLSGQPPGIYQRTPEVVITPNEVRVQTILPETIEVEIIVANTTPNPGLSGSITPTVVLTPSPSATPRP